MYQQANIHTAQLAKELCNNVIYWLKSKKFNADVSKRTVEVEFTNNLGSLSVEYDVVTANERTIGDGNITPIEFCFSYVIQLKSIVVYDEDGDLAGSLLYCDKVKSLIKGIIEDDNVYEKYYEDAENKYFG